MIWLLFIPFVVGETVFVDYFSDSTCDDSAWMYSSQRGFTTEGCVPHTFFGIPQFIMSSCEDGQLITRIYSDEACKDFVRSEETPIYSDCVKSDYDGSTYVRGTCTGEKKENSIDIQVIASLNPSDACDTQHAMALFSFLVGDRKCIPLPFEQPDLGWEDSKSITVKCNSETKGATITSFSDSACSDSIGQFPVKEKGECSIIIPNVTIAAMLLSGCN